MPVSDDELPDFDVEGPSPTFDLVTTSLWDELKEVANLKVDDPVLEQQLRDNVALVVSKISLALGEYKAGYLLRVNIGTDTNGRPVIPGGELLTPIGLGREPVDALAELYRVPEFAQPPAKNYRDQSFYFWLTR